jgi:hypothetical protein
LQFIFFLESCHAIGRIKGAGGWTLVLVAGSRRHEKCLKSADKFNE